MATKAPGFLSADGRYFQTEREALAHETAQAALRLVGRESADAQPSGLYAWLIAAQKAGVTISVPAGPGIAEPFSMG